MPYGLNRQFYRARLVTPPRIRRTFGVAARRAQGYSPYARAAAGRFARRQLYRRALTGGAIAAGGLAAYGMYRGIRRFRRRKTARQVHARNRRFVGVRPGSNRTKARFVQNTIANPHTSYTLHQSSCTEIGAIGSDQGSRKHNDINLRGFRLNLRGYHNSSTQMGVLTMMIVVLKNDTAASAMTDNFFKSKDTTADINFGDATLDGSDYVDLAYNKEKINVLWYKRLKLAPKQSPDPRDMVAPNARNYFEISEYVKMNRQLNFDSAATTNVEDHERIYFLHWYAKPFSAPTTPVSGEYTLSRKIQAIWREVGH